MELVGVNESRKKVSFEPRFGISDLIMIMIIDHLIQDTSPDTPTSQDSFH